MMLRLSTFRTRVLRPCLPRYPSRAVSTSAPPLIRIQDATFYENYPTAENEAKRQNPPLVPDLSFTLPSGPTEGGLEHWAVIGAAGRTQFLEVLRGRHICIPPTARSYPYLLTDDIAKKNLRLRHPSNAIQYIGFSGEGSGAIGGTRGAYLSARYESLREETDWTVHQYLKGQTSLNPLEEEREGNVRDEKLFLQVVAELHLEELLEMPVANLSNGQTRRARIAKALLSKPELLLLDDAFMGLDPATARSISNLLHRLASKSDPRLVLSLRPQDTIPDWITHILVLGNSNRIVAQGTRSHMKDVFNMWGKMARIRNTHKNNKEHKELAEKTKSDLDAGHLDPQLLWDLQLVPQDKPTPTQELPPPGGEPLVEMDGVRVQYGDKVVLGDWNQHVREKEREGLHWTVRRGQRWAILGANGSGKTTLLSLITSDHPQAYALPIKLLGRSRLPEAGKPGISIFELQSRIGHSSPEIHAFFPRQLTIRQSLESAFAETFLSKPALDHDRDLDVSAALRFFRAELNPNFNITAEQDPPSIEQDPVYFPKSRYYRPVFSPLDYDVDYADTVTFGQCSTAHQRLILFLRAMVSKPDILILDEPFSGMTSSLRDKCIYFLEYGETSRPKETCLSGRPARPRRNPWITSDPFPKDTLTPLTTSVSGSTPISYLRHTGLTESQALIMISHVREEIPNSVRHYIRLPSTMHDADSGLDFRCGTLKGKSFLSQPKIWGLAWAPKEEFESKASRSTRQRKSKAKRLDGDEFDEEVHEWWSI
ncbi:P-loop containing nucleoside triphosphate hydrolase protein [Aspergillus cavernicola]|uniref:P-loop containing nucleoside triphosphate hydrolase protein n=1 Tax=Aspergillus cavernicola TaxID=176166 RepID=A0ABR4IIC9_9EURO